MDSNFIHSEWMNHSSNSLLQTFWIYYETFEKMKQEIQFVSGNHHYWYSWNESVCFCLRCCNKWMCTKKTLLLFSGLVFGWFIQTICCIFRTKCYFQQNWIETFECIQHSKYSFKEGKTSHLHMLINFYQGNWIVNLN